VGESRVTARLCKGDVKFKHPFSCLVSGPEGQSIRRLEFAFCKTSKNSVPSLTSAVESSCAI
jgi:hypothetical protein